MFRSQNFVNATSHLAYGTTVEENQKQNHKKCQIIIITNNIHNNIKYVFIHIRFRKTNAQLLILLVIRIQFHVNDGRNRPISLFFTSFFCFVFFSFHFYGFHKTVFVFSFHSSGCLFVDVIFGNRSERMIKMKKKNLNTVY